MEMGNIFVPNQMLHMRERGFTLMELMIVLAIVAILLGVGLPGYQNIILKSNRAAGKGVLLDVAMRQEQFFINNKAYSDNLATSAGGLGYPAHPFFINNQADKTAASTSESIYQISVALVASVYTISATPVGRQTKDTGCGMLTLTSLGVKDENGTQSVADCW